MLVEAGLTDPSVRILTGSGVKALRLLERRGLRFLFEMAMGRPVVKEGDLRFSLELAEGAREVTIVDVGNPQCSLEVEDLAFDWVRLGAEIEGHSHFPRRTNVSFFRRVDDHTIEARFFERGAGATLSSGTGSTGAAAAAVLRGVVESPVRVITEAGPLDLRWQDGVVSLTGPAEITARGEFFWDEGGHP